MNIINKIKSIAKKIRENQIYSTVAFLLSLTILFSATTVSFAWFVNFFRSNDINFNSGKIQDNDLYIAKVHHNDSVESARSYEKCENYKIEHNSLPKAIEGGELYQIDINNLSFGTIDNVAMLKPENIVYFRIDVPKESGENVHIAFNHGGEEDSTFIDLYYNEYDDDGETVLGQKQVSDTIINQMQSLEDTLGCFIRYSAIVSNTLVAASDLNTLTFNTFYSVNSDNSFSLVNEDIENAGEHYYIYIRVEPDLNVFSHSIEYISNIMPCHIYFNIKAEFEIR